MHRFYLCAAGPDAGLTSVALGLARAFDRLGIRVAFCKPISQRDEAGDGVDASIGFATALFGVAPPPPMTIGEAQQRLREGRLDDLLERVVDLVEGLTSLADVIIVEGLLPEEGAPFKDHLNREMAKALAAELILVARHRAGDATGFVERLRLAATAFGGIADGAIVGCIANRVAWEGERDGETRAASLGVIDEDPEPAAASRSATTERLRAEADALRAALRTDSAEAVALVGCVPDEPALRAVRMSDIAAELDAELVHDVDLRARRVRSIALCARQVPNMLHVLRPGALIVVPADRHDIIMAAALASLNHVPLAGLVLTGTMGLDPRIVELCRKGLAGTELPVLRTWLDSFQTASHLAAMPAEVPPDDVPRIEQVVDTIARQLDADWLRQRLTVEVQPRRSPAAFRHMLTSRARTLGRRILLPEGTEPRTLRAATICAERHIARCVLLGDPAEIRRVAAAHALDLPEGLEIIDPAPLRDRYFEPLMAWRGPRGLSEERGREELEDNVVAGLMMLALGEADGLVAGAVHRSADVVRPALQLVRTRPGARLVSSVFFMCLPDDVLVYGDCAINPDPGAQALADIAIRSAETAEQFGIEPRVALISYSTGESGQGDDVDKVREAARIARELRPDLPIDGPLQYDAAASPEVAASKAAGSPVAGRATVFVFPDLNTGNTTYKAVQRSTGAVSIGPILQGLAKPVNDLSRGARVDDIVYTIAATAIQAATAPG